MKAMKRLTANLVLTFVLGILIFSVSCQSMRHTQTTPGTGRSAPPETSELSWQADATADEKPLVSISDSGPLRISLNDAVMLAMQNNPALVVERLNPAIQETFIDEQQAVFDPVLGAEISTQRTDSERQSLLGSDTIDTTTDVYQGTISLKDFFPTGAFLEAEISSNVTDTYQDHDLVVFAKSRLGLSITQSLLRGFGSEANQVKVEQSRLGTVISRYELRGFSEALVGQVENAYWDYALSKRKIEIVEESLKLARQQMAETEEMIRVGTMAEAEMAAVQAEVAAQKQGLINAKSTLQSKRILLLRLLNPPGESFWNREVELLHPPTLPDAVLDEVMTHVAVSHRLRPEINQAKLEIQQSELELVRTKNGLLPRLDLFINLGKTGYADSFSGSLSDLPEDNYDALIGLNFEYPLRNRSADAHRRRSLLRKDQAEKVLANLSQLVELDVRQAYIEVNRTREQITASAATRKFQEEKLRIETEKFRVGSSTNFFVSQAQRDLLVNRINEVSAVVDYLKALTNFYRLEGSLLERRGIAAPGGEPVQD